MPQFNLDSLDDSPVFDASASFSGGMVSNSRANLLTPEQSAELINCDTTITGQLVTRRGTSNVGNNDIGGNAYIQGLTYFDSPAFQYLMTFSKRRLYYLSGVSWTEIPGYLAISSLVQVFMVQGINKIYIIDGTNNIYSWDGTGFFNLGSTTNSQPPAAPRTIEWHTSRLFAAGMLAEPDAIYVSDFLGAQTWDRLQNQVRVGGGDADLITRILSWTNFNLLVFKKRSIWVVNCNPALPVSDWEITGLNRIHGSIGCIAPLTPAQVGSDVFFLSDSGVRSVQRTLASEAQTQLGEAISFPIQDVIDRINPNAIATSCAAYWNNKYILAIPIDSATSPNAVVVYNNLTQSWSGIWTGVNITSMAVRGVAGDNPRLSLGLNNGKVVDWMDFVQMADESDTTYQDSGVAIPTSDKTRAFTFSEPACPKTGLNLELEFNESTATVTVEAILDDTNPIALQESPVSTGAGGITLPTTLPFGFPPIGVVRKRFDLQFLPQFRELQFKLSSTSGKMSLRNIAASAFIDTLPLQL